MTSPNVLFADEDATSRGQAEAFVGAAQALGLEVSAARLLGSRGA